MTFIEQFAEVKRILDGEGFPFLVVGGLAVQSYGYNRSTMDVDIMLVVQDEMDFVRCLKRHGFDYVSILPVAIFAKKPQWTQRVDFLRITSDTFEKLMQGAVEVKIAECVVKIPSIRNLIAMKFHSYKQGGVRRMKDLNDIAWLTVLNGLDPEADLHPAAMKYADESVYEEAVRLVKSLGGVE